MLDSEVVISFVVDGVEVTTVSVPKSEVVNSEVENVFVDIGVNEFVVVLGFVVVDIIGKPFVVSVIVNWLITVDVVCVLSVLVMTVVVSDCVTSGSFMRFMMSK